MMTNAKNVSKKELPRIGVIGFGWLGSALSEVLIKRNYYVVATTQTEEKIKDIEKIGAQAEIIKLPFNDFNVSTAAIFYCETLIVCIPPQIKKGREDYPQKIADIVNNAEQSLVKKIILISSTAIYNGNLGDVTEQTALKLDDKKVNILSEAEQYVINFSRQSIVIRAAGLVGPQRHPGRFFKNNRLLTAPNAYVNLLHQTDLIAQLIAFVEHKTASGVYNSVSEMQVTKKHYYTLAAKALKLPIPEFDQHSEVELGRKVIGDKLRDSIGFQYQYDDLVSWLIRSELACQT